MREIEFKCEPWVTRTSPNGKDVDIQAIKGTWTLAPLGLRQSQGVKGILSCPNCERMALILRDMGEKGDHPHHRILPQWHCNGCHLEGKVKLLDWDKRELYCAAFETTDAKGKIAAHKEYMHAESVVDATAQFWAGRLPSDRVSNLVGIAKVIGFFVLDSQGKKLEV